MPCRNVLKIDIAESFYHVYARGHSRSEIFVDESDYFVFLNLLKRYLGAEAQYNKYGNPYAHLHGKLELVSYCLMPNHFHLLLYQVEEGAMTTLMRGLMTSYSRYFNRKYGRSGALCETPYKASRIDTDGYLDHITRYIHLNRKDWATTPYSSIGYYIDGRKADWLLPNRIMQLFNGSDDYVRFMEDYEENKMMWDEIKYELANYTRP